MKQSLSSQSFLRSVSNAFSWFPLWWCTLCFTSSQQTFFTAAHFSSRGASNQRRFRCILLLQQVIKQILQKLVSSAVDQEIGHVIVTGICRCHSLKMCQINSDWPMYVAENGSTLCIGLLRVWAFPRSFSLLNNTFVKTSSKPLSVCRLLTQRLLLMFPIVTMILIK